MKGFLKRDLYLLLPSLKLYAAFVVAMMVISLVSDTNMTTVVSMYVFIYMIAGVTGLFNSDNVNQWQAYAAATPNGRRRVVDARYGLTLLLCAVASVISSLMAAAARSNSGVVMAVLYSGAALIYASLVLPIGYKFGGDRTRVIMLIVVVVGAGFTAAAGTSLGPDMESGTSAFTLPVVSFLSAAGLAALAVSWRISRRIMAAKEL